MRAIVVLISVVISSQAFAESMTLKAGYNLRSQPSLRSGEVLHTPTEDQQVEVIDTARNFTKIRYKGKRYWVHSTGLTDQPENINLPKPGQVLTASRDKREIRNLPGTMTKGGFIMSKVDRDFEMTYVDATQDADGDTWYRVKFQSYGQEKTGYIYEGSVSVGNQSNKTAAGTTCNGPDCQREPRTIVQQGQAILDAMAGKGFALPSSFNGRCSNFINRNGLGDWGRRMVQAAKTVAPNCFYKDNAFNSLCPNYRQLNESQKNAFIALLFASIGQVESSCNPRAQAQGSYDVADGIFQMEYSAGKRARAGRNSRWCRTSGRTDTQSWSFQSECAVSIIEDTVCKKDRQLNYASGYWQKLRNQRQIFQTIKRTAKQWGICK